MQKGSTKSNNSSFLLENLTPISNINRSTREIIERNGHNNMSFDLKDNKTEFINKVYSIKNKVKAITTCILQIEREFYVYFFKK